MVGFDQKKLDDLIQSALLLEQTNNDENVIKLLMKQIEDSISDGYYERAL